VTSREELFRIEEMPGVVVVRVQPRRIFLDLADRFREELLRLVRETEGAVILDLSQVNVMNSTALGTLIVVSDLMKKSSRPFFVASPGKVLREVLERMRLDTLLPVRTSVEQACAEAQETL